MEMVLGLSIITIVELLIEVIQFIATGRHNWLAISYAIMFGIFAIISAIFIQQQKNERR